VIVPTIALGESHQETFEKMDVKSIFLKGSSTKKDYDLALDASAPAALRPRVIILTPESLFGTDTTKGIIDKLDANRLEFIAVDEVHLVLEWATFRNCFTKIQQLKTRFSCPILSLTATMKPEALAIVTNSILRSPFGRFLLI